VRNHAETRDVRQPRRSFFERTARVGGAALFSVAGGFTRIRMAGASAAGAAESTLPARIVAAGLPDISALAPIGTFHPGGPINDKPEFVEFTQPARVLDRNRLFVASTANFGAPLAQPDAAAGAILSLDPSSAEVLVIPPTFAVRGDQASTLDRRVQLYTAQSPAFVNRVTTPGAVTASLASVSNPRAISINNAFGRPWFANAPRGIGALGTETVIDPSGVPLAGAPSQLAGGVFAADVTNRQPQLAEGGLDFGALGTALLGKSPDGSGRAVFAVVCADGCVVQVHVEKGVDGLAPPGTVGWFSDGPPSDASAGSMATRAGMLLNWVPDQIVYVADPNRNAIVALTLIEDGTIFRVIDVRHIALPELDVPVDLAPAIPEVANAGFASNTTLAGASDIYAANRGSGTIVRLKQDGTVVAVRQIEVPGLGTLGAGRLNGITVSPDAQKIWASVSGSLPVGGQSLEGALIELPAFGAANG
jgi:hypothetical protein